MHLLNYSLHMRANTIRRNMAITKHMITIEKRKNKLFY